MYLLFIYFFIVSVVKSSSRKKVSLPITSKSLVSSSSATSNERPPAPHPRNARKKDVLSFNVSSSVSSDEERIMRPQTPHPFLLQHIQKEGMSMSVAISKGGAAKAASECTTDWNFDFGTSRSKKKKERGNGFLPFERSSPSLQRIYPSSSSSISSSIYDERRVGVGEKKQIEGNPRGKGKHKRYHRHVTIDQWADDI